MAGQLPIDRARQAKDADAKQFDEARRKLGEEEARLRRKAREHDDEFEPDQPELEIERADKEREDDADEDDGEEA
jgi:hypothetical protein